MKQISTSICLGLGDNIVARIIFDTVKHEYNLIKISHDKNVIRHHKNGDSAYLKFLDDIGTLLFTEPPYIFDHNAYQAIHTLNTVKSLSVPVTKPKLQHLLCKGTPISIDEEYVVITTKIRAISRKKILPMLIKLWKVLQKLSTKYKIVILGEREVEKNVEYGHFMDLAYGIYDQIITNLPTDRVIDLTIPALGVTAPTLPQIQQDGLIMQRAKFIITLGLGGNVWLAATAGNKVIGYRNETDNDYAADIILNPNFTSAKIFKNWDEFIKTLEGS
jgi:hypothetical protein